MKERLPRGVLGLEAGAPADELAALGRAEQMGQPARQAGLGGVVAALDELFADPGGAGDTAPGRASAPVVLPPARSA